ncbi:MAG: TetR/AcrR family transcriptional regulator [Pseudomonadota bacterium]
MSEQLILEKDLTRFERRKASTRAKIIEAAERLMRDRGGDAVTIQDITDAADVGHGTFYLHFKNKWDVLRPLIARLSEQVHEKVDQAARGTTDPALRQALGLRLLLRAIVADPLWSWYARSGMAFSRMVSEMGEPPTKDMTRGTASGRYSIIDLPVTLSFINGAVTGMIRSISDKNDVDEPIDHTVELILRVLGVGPDEAARIVREPLEIH